MKKGPGEKHPAETTPAEIRGAQQIVADRVSKEDRIARLEADKKKLEGASKMRRALAEEYVAKGDDGASGAMIRGRNKVFERQYRDEQRLAAASVLGGRPLRGVVECDHSAGRMALEGEAAAGRLAALSVTPERAAEILGARPGDEKFALNRAAFRSMTDPHRVAFEVSPLNTLFRGWKEGNMSRLQTERVAAGDVRA